MIAWIDAQLPPSMAPASEMDVGLMTPFGLTLEHDLDAEVIRFANKWLFNWHNINIEGRATDVEDFYDGRIQVGGIVFEGQIQSIYWHSVEKYLSDLIDAKFHTWDAATAKYPLGVRNDSLAGVERRLSGFAAQIIRDAIDTDRRLRGRGFPENVDIFNATSYQTGARKQITRLADAHRNLNPPKPKLSMIDRVEEFFSKRKGFWRIGSFLVGIFLKLFIR